MGWKSVWSNFGVKAKNWTGRLNFGNSPFLRKNVGF